MTDRRQPVVLGISDKGELIWDSVPMAHWQMAMFPIHYNGDFGIQWMWTCLREKGLEWDEG